MLATPAAWGDDCLPVCIRTGRNEGVTMTTRTRTRVTAVLLGATLAFGGAATVAVPAAASPASDAFSRCMDPYLEGQRTYLNAKQDKVALAILYTGYARCYYDLSQRSDISSQTEINAINNFNTYYARAKQAIAKAGLAYYQKVLTKLGLRGLTM